MSFNGLIAQLPIGFSGLTGTHSLSQVAITQLLQAQNVTYENGTIQKEGGALKYTAGIIGGAPAILGGWDWWPTPLIQKSVIFTSAGSLLQDAGLGSYPITLATGLSTVNGAITTVPVFAEGGSEAILNNKKLFLFTGGNQVKVVSGAGVTATNVSKPATDWSGTFPTCGCLHNNRMWAAMGHRLYYSQFTDHEDFQDVTNAGTLACYPGEGEGIVGLLSFKGILFVFKYPYGIYVVNTLDPTVANWTLARQSRAIGVAGAGSIVNIDDDVIFMDPSGVFHLLSTVNEFGDFGMDTASTAAQMNYFVRDNLNLARLRNCQAVFYPAKREIHFALSHSISGPNDSRLVIDLNVTGAIRWRYSDRDINESLWLRKDSNGIPRLTAGDNAGSVYSLDQTTRIKDGAGYIGKFQSPHLDMSHINPNYAAKRKNGMFLEVVVEPKGNWNLLVDIFWDGTYSQTVAFNMGIVGVTLGSFILGTDQLGADAVLNKKRRITGGGRRISIVGYNNGAGEDFSVSTFYLHYTLGDERLKQ